jgi:hypothetical protein
MGLSNQNTNISIVAKLTPFGRQELLKNSSSAITHFALGDSEAYYGTTNPLGTGEMPDLSGNLSVNGNSNNSTADGFKPKSLLYVDSLGRRKKEVKIGSNKIVNSKKTLGYDTLSGTSLSYNLVDLNDYNTDSRVNWFYGFALPISDADEALFETTPSVKGGYSDTAYSALSQDEILVLGIPASEYGEVLDGKSLKVEVNGYTLYSTFQSTLSKNSILDASFKEKSFNASIFGNNVAFLFSDDIQKPNNDVTKSWATKYGTTRPFSNGKPKFNYKSDSATNKVADKIVGIAYLDKGLITIVDPTIVSSISGSTSGLTGSTNVEYNSVTTQITQEITCIADRGEFGRSANPTFTDGDVTRISEILLLDKNDNIMAVGKTDRHLEKTAQQFLALGIKITV